MHTRPQQHLNRWPTAKLTSGHPRHAGGAHLVQRGREASGAGALCPPSGSRRGRASRRPLRCRPRLRQASVGRRCRAAPGTVRDFPTPLPRAQAPGASTVRGHIYLAQITPVPVVVRGHRTPQCPPLRYTSPAISQTAKRRKFRSERGETTGSKTMFSISRLYARSGFLRFF